MGLEHITDQGDEQTQHDGRAQRDADVSPVHAETEIAGQFAKTEAAQEGGEPVDQEEGEEGDEEPAHGVLSFLKVEIAMKIIAAGARVDWSRG